MKKSGIFKWTLRILVIVQFLAITYINFTRSYGFLEFDTSFAIRHAVDMWRDGLFLQDFAYVTSMEIDCATFFAAPIYLLTHNLNLALGIVHGLFYALIVYLLYEISINAVPSDRKGREEGFLLSVLLVFTPYASKIGYLDWSNMLFICGGQYEFRVICLLWLLNVMLMSERTDVGRVKFFVHLFFCGLFCFWTSLSTGNFVLCMIVLPFVLKLGLSAVLKQRFKIISRESISLILVCALCILAMGIRKYLAIGSHRNDLPLIGARDFWSNVLNTITGIFLLFGGLPRGGDVGLFSLEGISSLMRFALVCLCFVLAWWEGKYRKNRTCVFLVFIVTAAVNLGLFFVTNSLYGSDIFEQRYHILWCYLMLIVAAYAVTDTEGKGWPNKLFAKLAAWGILILTAAINLTGFKDLWSVKTNRWYEDAVLRLADEYQVENIIAYDNIETVSSLLAMDPDRKSLSLIYSDGMCSVDTNDYLFTVQDNAFAYGKHLFICDEWYFVTLPDYIQSSYTLVDSTIVGPGHNIYYADESPWDGTSGLPHASADKAIDFPYSNGYRYSGTINSNGQLTAESTEDGFVLWGPYANAVPGVYDITLYYHILEEGNFPAFFGIRAENGARTLVSGYLPVNAQSFTLQGVSITGSAPLEFSVWQAAGGKIVIDRIEFERVPE